MRTDLRLSASPWASESADVIWRDFDEFRLLMTSIVEIAIIAAAAISSETRTSTSVNPPSRRVLRLWRSLSITSAFICMPPHSASPSLGGRHNLDSPSHLFGVRVGCSHHVITAVDGGQRRESGERQIEFPRVDATPRVA